MSNRELALSLVKMYLIDLSDYFNVSRPMTMNQIAQTAEMIIDEYPQATITDIVYTFKQAKLGKFGLMYESMDGSKIISWIGQVFAERLEAGAQMSENEHKAHKREMQEWVGDRRSSDGGSLRELIHDAQVKYQNGTL